jgi:large subunit ribosomal protein L31
MCSKRSFGKHIGQVADFSFLLHIPRVSDIFVCMKKDIHPTYFPNATVTCVCGSVMNIGGTKEKMNVEICSNCHPFFTGNEKSLDSAGRVEKFKNRAAAKKSAK